MAQSSHSVKLHTRIRIGVHIPHHREMGVGEEFSPVSTLGASLRIFKVEGRERFIFVVEDAGKACAAAIGNRFQTSGESSDRYNLHFFQLLLDRFATFLARGNIVAFTHAAAGGLVLSGRAGCGSGFARRGEGSTAGGGFGALARVDFGFQGCGFGSDDAESTFNGVVGGTCGLLVKVRGEREVRGGL